MMKIQAAVQVRVKQVKTKYLQHQTTMKLDGKIADLGWIVTTPPFRLHLPPSNHLLHPLKVTCLLSYQHLQSPTVTGSIWNLRQHQHGLVILL